MRLYVSSATRPEGITHPSIDELLEKTDSKYSLVIYGDGTASRDYVHVDDIASATITLETASDLDGVFDQTWQTSDYQMEPLNRTASGLSSAQAQKLTAKPTVARASINPGLPVLVCVLLLLIPIPT